jgi:5-methylcytosine-specific restriction protein B
MQVRSLIDFYGGIIFTGPPGTSKSWYAAKIGTALVSGDTSRIRFVQFHPSYQYEDFMQGYVPKKNGEGFELRPRHFMQMCQKAGGDPDQLYVLVIDELSRGDPGRVFGEALTYVEKSKRGLPFLLASGDECVVPDNLVVLATMNPLDRGVDEVDAAFERRFAKISMQPDRDILASILDTNGLESDLRRRLIGFFDFVNGRARTTPHAAVGHTYFSDVRDESSLRTVWDHQIRFLVEKAYRLDPGAYTEIEAAWLRIFRATTPRPRDGASGEAGTDSEFAGGGPSSEAGQGEQ